MALSNDENEESDRLAEEEVANRAAAATVVAAAAPSVRTLAYSKITNPHDKPWDLSTKNDVLRLMNASTPKADWTCFDVSVSTSLVLMDLLTDKSSLFRWTSLF